MDTIDGIIMLLVLLAGLCFVVKLLFLWSAIASLFRKPTDEDQNAAELAEAAIAKARRKREHTAE